MKLSTFLLTAFLLMSVSMNAQHVTEEQALQKAQEFMNKKVTTAKGGRHNAPRKLRKLAKAARNDAYYIFNAEQNGGFVIVSGDERTEEILAYSTEGNINLTAMPENMQAWLKGYEEQILAIPADAKVSPKKIPTHPAVEPLLRSKWNQGAPYNLQCPTQIPEGGTEPQHCWTGCVATAMAQIMYYWQYPQDYTTVVPGWGYGDVSWNEELQQLDYSDYYPDLPPTKFDWANMKDTYDGTETDASADAVAMLMHYCGWGSKMDYGLDGSAAYENYTAYAFHHYFGYDQNIRYIQRPNYRTERGYSHGEWDELIYEEISARRPVLYHGGSSGVGGHAFVCDGYDGDGMYHFNWGWSGSGDCFCRLSVVAPSSYYEEKGFKNGQSAIVGIQPPTGLPLDYEKGIETHISVNKWTPLGDPTAEGVISLDVWTTNQLTVDIRNDAAIGIADEYGTVSLFEVFWDSNDYPDWVCPNIGSDSHSDAGKDYSRQDLNLPDGTYRFVAMYKGNSETEWHTGHSLDVTLADGTISEAEKPAQLEFVDIKLGGSMMTGEEQYADVTFRAIGGDCQDIFFFGITQSNDIDSFEDWGKHDWTQIFVNDGEKETVRVHFTSSEAGDYHFVIGIRDGSRAVNYDDGSIAYLPLYERHHADFTISNPLNLYLYGNTFDWSTMTMPITVRNNDEVDYDREVAVRFYPREDYGKENAGQVFKSGTLHIEPKKSVEVSIPCPGLDIDRLYSVDLMYYKNPDNDALGRYTSVSYLTPESHGRIRADGIRYAIVDTEQHYVFADRCTSDAAEVLVVPSTVVSTEDCTTYAVKGVSRYVFQYQEIKSVALLEGITTIEGDLFYGCEKLESITLPSTINRIGARVINQCPNLKSIYVKNPEAPLVVDYGISENLLVQTEQYETVTLYVPVGSGEVYAKAWPQFKNIVEMDFDAVNDIADLSNSKQYIIRSKDETRGSLGVAYGELASTNPAAQGHKCEEATPFAILQYDGNYYLYSTADRKFITRTGGETDAPGQDGTHAVTVTKNTNGYFMFSFTSTGNVININDSPGIDINTWGQTEDKWDDGNQFTIEEAGDFDPTDALAMFVVDNMPDVTGKTFTLRCERGYVGYDGSTLCSTTQEAASEFAIVDYGTTNYLYDVTNKAFVIHSTAAMAGDMGNRSLESSTYFAAAVTGLTWGKTGFETYPWYLEDSFTNWMNMDGELKVCMNTWKDFQDGNGGNTYQVEVVSTSFDATEAIQMLDNYFQTAVEVTDEQYQAALNSVETDTQYAIYTLKGGTRYYLTSEGYLTANPTKNCVLTFARTEGDGLFRSPGWKVDACFTNPHLSENGGESGALLPQGHILTDSQGRDDWDGQVWYLGDNGCYAVRATNAVSDTWGANTYWTVLDTNGDGVPEADYSWAPAFVWQLESDVVSVGIHDIDNGQSREADAWYTLDGRKLSGKPATKGIFIRNSKKVVVR